MGGKQASEILGVHQRTLYNWDAKGIIDVIRTPGGKRLYNVEKFLKEKECKDDVVCITNLKKLDEMKGMLNISYARVSSLKQSEDLERQKKILRNHYPKNVLIEDIGSGINFNKKGIKKIIYLAIAGRVKKLVVAYKDRLTRIGFELIEELIKVYSKGEIIILNKKDDLEPEDQLAFDVLEIMNIFVAKRNGLRRYKDIKKTKKKN